MGTVDALIVVDTEGALSSGSAVDNSYLVDNNGYLGSWNEGKSWRRLFGQRPAGFKWIPAGLC
ncbi:hypothetical protein HU675_0036910 [Bradyrhizobium septentrionale]|uniref:hypothetical protein n=1 Tax=Bradyrhizobium septentrionale TaxID=1404411 RepID=UPI00159701F9|nr:hypothetical protein [Bradyrhizobium septentrionale]UGY23486.1 hypothetical protein HU675_0036910 [Bradyrhizobium septentrionale]